MGQVERQLWQGRKQGIFVPKKIHMRNDDEEIVNGMVRLLMNYKTQRSWSLAEKLVTSIDAHIYNHFKGTLNWQNGQMIKMEIRQKIGDYKGAAMLLQEIQDVNGDLEFVSICEHTAASGS